MRGHLQHLGGCLVGEDDLPVDGLDRDNLATPVGPPLVNHLGSKASGILVVVRSGEGETVQLPLMVALKNLWTVAK